MILNLVGFTTINGNMVFVNPKYVVSVHSYGMADSEINLANGIDVQVKQFPERTAQLLVHGYIDTE